MRKCQKCGAEYANTDFRTLCSYCMSNLAAAPVDAPAEEMTTGPISMGGPIDEPPVIPTTITMPEITMPEFTLPEMAPGPDISMMGEGELLAPEEAAAPDPVLPEFPPRPGPYRPPLTPQPNPAVPQPPITPEPERQPGVPAPQPAPVPAPRPQPVPQPVPQPMPVPQPAEPSPTGKIVQGNPIPAEKISEAKVVTAAYGFLCVVCAILALTALFSGLDFFGLIFSIGLGYLAYYFGRQMSYRSAIESAKAVLPERLAGLGETIPVEITITPVRDIRVTAVNVTLLGEERAIKGSGKTRQVFRHSFVTQVVRVQCQSQWHGGYQHRATVFVTIPADAAPSFAGQHNFIEWSITLNATIDGVPNIRERIPLVVAARQPGAPSPDGRPVYQLPQLGPLNAQIGFNCPVTEQNMPIFPAGRQIPYQLRLNPQGDYAKQRVWVELSYAVNGSGDSENMVISRHPFSIENWIGDPQRTESGTLLIPPPPTFHGTHVRIFWAVTVRHEKPWGQDSRQVFEVLVTPGYQDVPPANAGEEKPGSAKQYRW